MIRNGNLFSKKNFQICDELTFSCLSIKSSFFSEKLLKNLSKIKTFRSMNAGSVSSDIDRSITNFERKRKEKMRCTRPEQLIAERRQLEKRRLHEHEGGGGGG